MKAMDLLTALGGVKDTYVIGAEDFRQGKHRVRHLPLKKAWLVAAVIAMALLLVGCAVVYVLSLQDMKVDEEIITQEGWGPSGEYGPVTEWVSSRLSLQGYNGSPEQLAMKEWLDFQDQYDQDHTLLNANNHNESGVPEQYNLNYNCYTMEMMDKLNEILNKYQLKPLGAYLIFQRWEEPLFYKALQIDSLCQPNAGPEGLSGYAFPEGSFHAEFDQTLAGEDASRIVAFTYAKRQYLYPYYFAVKDLDLWEQWHYTTADGTDVLLATYENALLIICDCEDGFIKIDTENPTPSTYYEQPAEAMTRQKAEQIADSFNYSIRPQPFDPDEVEAMRANYPEPERQESPYIGFRIMPDGRWFPRAEIADSLEHYIDFLLEISPNPDDLEYCIVDLDGDGEIEVVTGRHDSETICSIIRMDSDNPDSLPEEVSYRSVNGCLYEGPILEEIYKYEYEDYTLVCHIFRDYHGNLITSFQNNTADNTWERLTNITEFYETEYETIPESEFRAYRDSLVPLSLDMKPLREFSIDD